MPLSRFGELAAASPRMQSFCLSDCGCACAFGGGTGGHSLLHDEPDYGCWAGAWQAVFIFNLNKDLKYSKPQNIELTLLRFRAITNILRFFIDHPIDNLPVRPALIVR